MDLLKLIIPFRHVEKVDNLTKKRFVTNWGHGQGHGILLEITINERFHKETEAYILGIIDALNYKE